MSAGSSLDSARRLLAAARSVAVLTGAGISAESGVPTFRGAGGLWRDYRPEDLATPGAFQRDPRTVWEWYEWRRGIVAKAQPNAGHRALVDLERRLPAFMLITQNVDGLHALAGSREVVELHGCLWRTRCTSCTRVADDRRVPLPEIPPRCGCGAILRPDVVWFGEMLDGGVLDRAYAALAACDLLLIVGTSGVVEPAASMGREVLVRGAPVVEVNLEPTPASGLYTVSLQGRAGEVLPALVAG